MKKQQSLVPPKKRDAVKDGIATGETGKAFRQKKRETVVEPLVESPKKEKDEALARAARMKREAEKLIDAAKKRGA